MKIDFLKINGFGKFQDKEIELKDGINIIYGPNEAGKSTIQKFISSMFFGLSKNKNAKVISDYDKYFPWNSGEFSGKIGYTLDNGNYYEVFRDFYKKNPTIYNNKKFDITDEFSIDKNKGILFFEEQTGVDENTFSDTSMAFQNNVKLDKSSQNNIVQKITNIISSGNENISYKETLNKLTKWQNERIGTNRTSQKPINIIENEILKKEKEKRDLILSFDENIDDDKIKEYSNLISDEESKLSLLNDMEIFLKSLDINYAELDYNKSIEDKYESEIYEITKKIESKKQENKNAEKFNYKILISIGIGLTILTIILFIFNKNYWKINFIPEILAVGMWGYIICNKIIKSRKIRQRKLEIEKLENEYIEQIECIESNQNEKHEESFVINKELENKIFENENNLSEKYKDKLTSSYIENVFAMDVEDIIFAKERVQSRIDEFKEKLFYIKINAEKVNNNQDKIKEIDLELEELRREHDELELLNESYELAIETLKESYSEMKEQISPDFTNDLSNIINRISDGKYTNVIFDDKSGLCVELSNGKYIPAELLSIGTIDELYLSLRLSALKEITNESMPIILDESFAYFDNNRLSNILEYFFSNDIKNQIIIFTCSNREKEVLNELGYRNYNFINI